MHAFSEHTRLPVPLRGPLASVVGGLIANMAMFMPSVVVFGDHALLPIELPPAAWPHFMGMFVALGAFLWMADDDSGSSVMAMVLTVLDCVAACGSGYVLMDQSPLLSLFLFGGFWVALANIRARPWRFARAVWLSGLLSCAWLGWFMIHGEPLYGLWVAGAGTSLLMLGGALLELDIRRRAQLPRARLFRKHADGEMAGR